MRVLRAATRFPCILARLPAHLRLGLRPDQLRKALRNAGHIAKVMRHVDKELKRQSEAILDQPRRQKHRLGRAEARIAMAHRAVAEINRVRRRDQHFAGVCNRQRNKIIRAALERRRQQRRNRAHQPFQIGLAHARLAPSGKVDAVRGTRDLHLRRHLLRWPKLDLRAARHKTVF